MKRTPELVHFIKREAHVCYLLETRKGMGILKSRECVGAKDGRQ